MTRRFSGGLWVPPELVGVVERGVRLYVAQREREGGRRHVPAEVRAFIDEASAIGRTLRVELAPDVSEPKRTCEPAPTFVAKTLLSTKEVAAVFGIGVRAVERQAQRGSLECVTRDPYRFDPVVVEAKRQRRE